MIVHARTTVPATQTYAIVVPIEKRRGEFRYRATVEPAAAGGRARRDHPLAGQDRPPLRRRRRPSAATSPPAAATTSSAATRIFTFAGGFVIEGVGLEKYCAQR